MTSQRPSRFTLNQSSTLAQGLVFAGLSPSGLVGSTHYHDSSPYGNHGTAYFDPAADWVFEPTLQRWCINGDATDNRVVLPSFTSANTGTWAMWSIGTPTTNGMWFDVSTNRSLLYRPGGGLGIYLFGQTVGDPTSFPSANDPAHYALTFRNGSQSLYKDGILAQSYTATLASSSYTLSAMRLLCRFNDVSFQAANIADFMWYSGRELSAAEIQQLADPSNVMLSGLIVPPRRRVWAVTTAGGTFTATAAIEAGGATLAASCAFSAGTKTADAAATTGSATVTIAASHTTPTFTADAAVSTSGVAGAATATFAVGSFTATVAGAAGTTSVSVSAAHTPPVFTSGVAATAGGVTCSAEAAYASGVFQATAAVETGGSTTVASATHTPPTFTATIASATSAAELASAAVFATVVFQGSASLDMGSVTVSIASTHAVPAFAATVAVTAGGAECDVSVSVSNPTYAATVAVETGGATTAVVATFTEAGAFQAAWAAGINSYIGLGA